MPNFAETANVCPQLVQAVENVFTEKQPSLRDVALDNIEFALTHNNPDVAYHVAQEAASLQDIKLEELPEGVQVQEEAYVAYDHTKENPAKLAQVIFDRVGSICFGDQSDEQSNGTKSVQIYAPDGRHTLSTHDLPKLISFLAAKGYKQSDVVTPEGTFIQPKPPLANTGIFPVNAQEVQYDTLAYPDSVPKIHITRQMNQSTREAAYVPTATSEKHTPEVLLTEPRTSIFPAGEQLLTISRVLLDKTVGRDRNDNLIEHSMKATLRGKYDISAEELDAAYQEVLDAEHHLRLFAYSAETRSLARDSIQTDQRFNVTTSRIINTALREFIDAKPSELGTENATNLTVAQLEARARAKVRKSDVKLAKLLVGDEEGVRQLNLCVTDALAVPRSIPLEIIEDQTNTTTRPFISTLDNNGVSRSKNFFMLEPTVQIPKLIIKAPETVETPVPTAVTPLPVQEKQSRVATLVNSVKAGFRTFGRRLGAAARSITRQYA